MNIYRLLAHPVKPEGIEKKKAYIVGGGIAGLAAAVFLIDDAGMPGENITIYEKRQYFGGCCDGFETPNGYVYPGEREIEPMMECLWYLCSKIPSESDPSISILDETYRVNRDSSIHSECRLLVDKGHIDESVHYSKMSEKTMAKMMTFLNLPEKDLENLTIEEYFGKDSDFFDSSMWWCFHTMLAFKPYHSALEAKRYLNRFGLGTRIDYLEGILHTKRNENDSIIKPIVKWLAEHKVNFSYGSDVYDLEFADKDCNTVTAIKFKNKEEQKVGKDDLVFVTNGSMMTNASFGDNTHVATLNRNTSDLGLFNIWVNLAKKHEKFGHPEKFLGQVDKTKWMSFFLTIEDYPEFFDTLERKTGSKRGTGGAITLKDSPWEFSFAVYDRDYFPDQKEKNRDVLWGDGLFGERIGELIKKPMGECTGNEILEELLYHLGLEDMKEEVMKHAHISLCNMPYITSQFMPRTKEDRPTIVPEGCTNLAFIGQYVEVDRDVVFTIETSVRTPLEAVYKLTKIDKDYIEVFPSKYDTRYMVETFKKHNGIEGKITKDDLPKMSHSKLLLNKDKIIDKLLYIINDIPPYYVMYQGRDQEIAHKKQSLNPEYPKVNEKK